ncbi:MAG: L-serine ammonia-lyase [Verrucomicrobia bacterium]|nr:L-serine ammonia-lyase [Verrucomicrobiota bacterium]
MSVLEATKRRYVPVSVFQLFSIGIGPSSSHTVGPMRAASLFAQDLVAKGHLPHLSSLTVELFGSLAMTGKGHATDVAILLGLEGYTPDGVDPNAVSSYIDRIHAEKTLHFLQKATLAFDVDTQLVYHKGKRFTYHSNAIRFKAFDARGNVLISDIYYSVGGGFVVPQDQVLEPTFTTSFEDPVPYPFQTCEELLEHCRSENKTIAEIVFANEKTWRTEEQIRTGILKIWDVMRECVKRGIQQEGILPGGLNVKRRAAQMYRELTKNGPDLSDPSELLDWVSLFALAVNEENAAGGRVVTAPTNGAAGVIPAVLHYYEKFTPNPTEEGIITFFLTAAAIGILYKEGASLSAAEMGCQGEVGVATSMAAGGLTATLGGTNGQIENAAEIGMEHNLGLTCDPVGGLVQIPCIERNTMGAIKAINASRLAFHGDGEHCVSLDQVIAAMRQTGEDMQSKYKETSEGGLALFVPVNLPEC